MPGFRTGPLLQRHSGSRHPLLHFSLQRRGLASKTTICCLAIPLLIDDVVHWLGSNTDDSLGPGCRSTLDMTAILLEELTPEGRRRLVELLYERCAWINCSSLRLNSELARKVYQEYYCRRSDVIYVQKALRGDCQALIQQIGAHAPGSGPRVMHELIPYATFY